MYAEANIQKGDAENCTLVLADRVSAATPTTNCNLSANGRIKGYDIMRLRAQNDSSVPSKRFLLLKVRGSQTQTLALC